MSGRRWLTGLAAVSVMVSGCGSMADPTLHADAVKAALGEGGGGQGQLGPAPAGGAGGASVGAGGAASGPSVGVGSANGGTVTAASGQGHAARQSSGAVAAPAGGNGGATDVGVTATTLTVGTIATLSGPVPGVFRGAIAGTQAYFAYVNSQGGVYGRVLKVDAGDDGFQCSQNKSLTAGMIRRDFAIVGGFSLYDYCGAEPLAQAPGVPDASFAISPQRNANKNNFSIQPLLPGSRTGNFRYYKSRFGDAYQHAAGLYSNQSSAISAWNGAAAAMKSLGYDVVYTRATGATDTNFTSDVIQMRQKNVKFVDLFEDEATIARFMQACQQQNYHPVITTPGSGYDQSVLTQGGSAVNGMYTDMPTAMYFSRGDAARISEVALYQRWMAQAAPGVNLDLFSIYGWTEAEMFVQALKAAGPKATRSGVLKALAGISSFNANGLIATGYPASKGPETCYVVVQVVNGQFERVDTPANGYRCDGPYYRL